jgi:hypothetical protein
MADLKQTDRRRKWSTIRKSADNISKAGWSWGCVSAIDSNGRTIWIADAHRDDGKRFVMRADEKLTAFLKLESANRASSIQNFHLFVNFRTHSMIFSLFLFFFDFAIGT